MTDNVNRLKDLAAVLLDHRLATLRETQRAVLQSEAALAGLTPPATPFGGLEGAAAELASLAYKRWADARKQEINLVLARQKHDRLVARDQAQVAFGKLTALNSLTEPNSARRRP